MAKMWLEGQPNRITYDSAQNARRVECTIYTDGDSLPTTGENVDGLMPTDILEAGTVVYKMNTQAVYMLDSEGTYVEQ